ncbi:uncharacterized protein F5147DRAFT_118857 [Suillus discolor]|uniref:Uncharacterized protein n=1 Tax=Suillus discolor TaxID=1912936 RepID=A0A9P7FIF0_9AGAM|nr:uncharacterized protein F5147DRAFT_118857 [Suillus discolor]KAG2119625.1 hypothetical protein F5147DRAFT_118857 [Suillus discolor]
MATFLASFVMDFVGRVHLLIIGMIGRMVILMITFGLEYAEHMGINNRLAENLLACSLSSSTQEAWKRLYMCTALRSSPPTSARREWRSRCSARCFRLWYSLKQVHVTILWRHFLETKGLSLEDINTTFGNEVAAHFSNLRDYSSRNYESNKGRYLTQRVHSTAG